MEVRVAANEFINVWQSATFMGLGEAEQGLIKTPEKV
jgi:hypothetical protein